MWWIICLGRSTFGHCIFTISENFISNTLEILDKNRSACSWIMIIWTGVPQHGSGECCSSQGAMKTARSSRAKIIYLRCTGVHSATARWKQDSSRQTFLYHALCCPRAISAVKTIAPSNAALPTTVTTVTQVRIVCVVASNSIIFSWANNKPT